MFSTFFQPCELKLHLLQNAIFLHPPDRPLPDTHERPPMANDEVVRGLVELYVPSTRHISGIRVRLKAVQTIAILDPASGLTPVSWEDSTVLEKVVEIGIQSDKEKHLIHHHQQRLAFNNRSASVGPVPYGASSSQPLPRGRSAATPDRSGRSGSAFGLRSNSPGGSIPASMARAVSRGRKIATGMGRISHSPSPSNSRSASRAASPNPPGLSERGRTATRAPPTYAYAISEASQNPPAAVPQDQEVVSHSLPASQAATPQRSRRPSFSDSQTPHESSGQESATETDELADHLNRSLAVHARAADRRSASATPVEQTSASTLGRHPQLHVEEDRGKGKSRSSSIGFFGSRKARSKSRAPLSRGVSGQPSDLVQVEEEGGRGRRGASVRPSMTPSGSSGGIAITPGSEGEGWESEPHQSGLELTKGVHGFEFAFIIPCDAPPYERSPFGRVRYIIKATAIGAGRAKSNVECWRDLYPMVNPSPDSGPTPLTVLYNDMHPTVGLVSIACTSNNISVGGVFNIDVNSPNPPSDLIVYLVRVSLEITIELTTKRKGKQTVPVQRHKLFEKGWVPPKNNDGSHGDGKKTDGFVRNCGREDAWTVQGIARMPDDNHVRASTVAASKAAIRFSHVLVVEIVHSRKPPGSTARTPEEEARERRLKVFALRQPVLVPSCCCAYDAVTLPAYSAAPDPNSRRAEMPYDLSSFSHHPPSSEDHPSDAPNTSTQRHST
uniref:Cyclin binding protein n=1 Tax=Kalmanozyma brasiliensis (strain GHG001) TaxID=1365824 RepID=V5EHK6_KALBG